MKKYTTIKGLFILTIVMALIMIYSATVLAQSGNAPIQTSKQKPSAASVKPEAKGKKSIKTEEQLRFEKKQAEAKGQSTADIEKALNDLNQNLTK